MPVEAPLGTAALKRPGKEEQGFVGGEGGTCLEVKGESKLV